MTTEPFEGTVRFLGVRASFAEAKELLTAALDEEVGLGARPSGEALRERIEAFLAQFEADA